ncbi:MAG: DUF481 domain-containing protein [Gemmatimonadota bacterium]
MTISSSQAASAQVIISYEGLDRSAGEDLYGTVQLSFNGNTGNADYVDLGLQAAIGVRGDAASGHWLRLYPSYRLRRSEGANVVHERSAHLRHSYVLSDALSTFSFVQIQADESLDLDRRLLIGGGLRRRLIRLDEGGLEVGIGVMVENELLDSGATRTDLRGANLVAVQGTAGTVGLSVTGFFQPVLSEFGDHRVSLLASATVPVSSQLEVGVSGYWRRDSRPPLNVEADDAGIRFVLRFSAD